MVLCMAAVGSVDARELFRWGDVSLEHSGSMREILLYAQQTDADRFERDLVRGLTPGLSGVAPCRVDFADCDAFDKVGDDDAFQSFTRLRNRFDLTLHPALRAVVVYDQEVDAGEIDTLESRISSGFADDTFFDAEGDIIDRQSVVWRHLLYRGYLQLDTEHFAVTAGRQRVAWGVGRLWQPIDRFSAVPPLSIQPDQSAGIDSVDARWVLDGFHYLQAVYAPGTSRDEAREALRFHGVFMDTDYSLMAGRFARAPTFGFDLSRNLGDAAAGLEVVYTNPEREIWPVGAPGPREPGDFWQVVVSLDGNLDLVDGVYWLVEHLYNGGALGFGEGKAGPLLNFFEETSQGVPGPADSAVFAGSTVVTGARHQTGLQLSTDVTPELNAALLTIVDWNGGSAIFFPTLRYAPFDFMEVTLGVQTPVGPKLSQYGDTGELAYLLFDFYF